MCVKDDGLRDWLSFGMLLFLCNVMVWSDYLGERSARNAIAAVEKLAAPGCSVKRNGSWGNLKVRELLPGDVVHLKGGIVIPADGIFITKGANITVDESALTGESLPVRRFAGDELLSGAIVQQGEADMKIIKIGEESFYGKTIMLLARAARQGHLRMVLDRAAKIITIFASLFAIFLFFWLGWFPDWKLIIPSNRILISLKRAFILIASVAPAAMPVVTTTVLAVGSLTISRENGLVSRLSAIAEAAGVLTLCSDKTGTLTKNVLTLFKEELNVEPGFTAEDVLVYASLASTIRDPEPIDKAINEQTNMERRAKYKVLEYIPFNPVDKHTVATVITPEGKKMQYSKGAPMVIAEMVSAEGSELRNTLHNLIIEKAKRGLRTLGVAQRELEPKEGPWELCGYISLFDPPREDTKETIEKARYLGIKVKMVTGDQQAIAIETARLLGLGTNIAGPEIWKEKDTGGKLHGMDFKDYVESVDGFAGVFPEHKFTIVDTLLDTNQLVAMTGDGVNDAPALKRATVGIAVSGATDAAKAAADIILLAPGLSTIITVLSLSRQIFQRVESYIIFRLFTSFIVLIFWTGAHTILDYMFPAWILVLMSMINDFVLMSCSRDNVPSSREPLIWSMARITCVSLMMSIICGCAIVAFVVFSDPMHGINWWIKWGLSGFHQDWPIPGHRVPMSTQTNAAVWLLLSLMIQLNFHAARTRGYFFQYNDQNLFPSLYVLIPQICACVFTLFLSVYWKHYWVVASGARMRGLSWGQAGVTVFWAFLWFLVTDVVKVLFYRHAWPRIHREEKNKAERKKGRLDRFKCFKSLKPIPRELKLRQDLRELNAALVARRERMRRVLHVMEAKVEDGITLAGTKAVAKLTRLHGKHPSSGASHPQASKETKEAAEKKEAAVEKQIFIFEDTGELPRAKAE